MYKLFVHDASGIRRNRYLDDIENPIYLGLKKSLSRIDLPDSFLIRGVTGDYSYHRLFGSEILLVKNTFNGQNIESFLTNILQNGTDRFMDHFDTSHPVERSVVDSLDVKFSDLIWATKYNSADDAIPYISSHYPFDVLNNVSIVLKADSYNVNSSILYNQNDKKIRQDSILGIVIACTDFKHKKESFMELDVSQSNVGDIVNELQKKRYFL